MKISALLNRFKAVPKHLMEGSIDSYLNKEWQQYQQRQDYREKQQRLAWWETKSGSLGSVTVEIQDGISMRLHFDSQLCKFLYVGGFETSERCFFNAYLRASDTVLDAGANVGLFTLLAAKLVGNQGVVHSFEPVSQVYKRLEKNILLNQLTNVSAHKIALSDETAQSQIVIALNGYDAWNSMAQPTAGDAFSSEPIQAMRLDDFIEQHSLLAPIALMKIDVEGWESHLLQGGSQLFASSNAPTLLIEFTEVNCQAAESSCQSLYCQLEAYGYEMFTYSAESRQLVPEPMRDNYEYSNLVATKDAKFVQTRLSSSDAVGWIR